MHNAMGLTRIASGATLSSRHLTNKPKEAIVMLLMIFALIGCAIITFIATVILTQSTKTASLFTIIATVFLFLYLRNGTLTFPALPDGTAIGMLFAFGTFWFWVLLAILTIEMFCLLEYDQGLGAGFSTLAALLLLEFFSDVKIFSYATLHPWRAGAYFIAYFFPFGAAYATARWWFYVSDKAERYKARKESFLKSKHFKSETIPDNLKQEWQKKIQEETGDVCCGYCGIKPLARKHKKQIVVWISYWPWSAAWWLISDFVKRIAKEIYRWIESLLQKIADYHFRGTENDFLK